MKTYCKYCGSQLNKKTGVCPKCKKKNCNNVGIQNNAQQVTKKIDKCKNRKHLFIILLIVIAITLGLGMGVLIIKHKNADHSLKKLIMKSFDTFIDEKTIAYSNGDIVFVPASKQITFDEENLVVYYNNVILVYTYSKLEEEEMFNLAKIVNGQVVGNITGAVNAIQIRVPDSTLTEIEEMTQKLTLSEKVIFAGYEYPISISSNKTNSDKRSSDNIDDNPWWINAVDVSGAWNYIQDHMDAIKIGVIDNGIEEHTALKGRLHFLEQYCENSIDKEAGGHGTHVAGIMAACDVDRGYKGIDYNADLYFVDWSPEEEMSYLSSCEYLEITKQLIENDVRAINNSWGRAIKSKEGFIKDECYGENRWLENITGYLYYWAHLLVADYAGTYDAYRQYIKNTGEHEAIDCMNQIIQLEINGYNKFLIIQSAGNGFIDENGYSINEGIDTKDNGAYCTISKEVYEKFNQNIRDKLYQEYEISYENIKDHVLIVGAVENKRDVKGNYYMAQFSNYGSNVDICAPGKNIYSTVLRNGYDELDGTSMAAPMVTASIALLWSINEEWDSKEIRDCILENNEYEAIGVGNGKGLSYPMLNIGKAVNSALYIKNQVNSERYSESILDNLFSGHFANMSLPMGLQDGCVYSYDKKFAIKASYDTENPENGAYYIMVVDMLGNVYDMFPISQYPSVITGWLNDDIFYNANGKSANIMRQGRDITDSFFADEVSLLDVANDDNGIHFLTAKMVFDSPHNSKDSKTDVKYEIRDDAGKVVVSFYKNEMINKYGVNSRKWLEIGSYHLVNLGSGIYHFSNKYSDDDINEAQYIFIDINREKVFAGRTNAESQYEDIESDGKYILIPHRYEKAVSLVNIETEETTFIENILNAHGLGEEKFFSDTGCYSVQGNNLFMNTDINVEGKIINTGAYYDGKASLIVDEGTYYQSRKHKYGVGFLDENGSNVNILFEIDASEMFNSYISSFDIYCLFSNEGIGGFLKNKSIFQEENVYRTSDSDCYYGVIDSNGKQLILRYGYINKNGSGENIQNAMYGYELFQIE